MLMLKRFGWVVFAATVICFPATLYSYHDLVAPFSYVVGAYIGGTLGKGLIAIIFGGITLIIGRNKSDGCLNEAILITVITSLIFSFFILYPKIRYLFI